MAEYTYDNILINPSKEGIESLIGKEVYFSDIPHVCLENANLNDFHYLGILEQIRKDGNAPFKVKGTLSTAYWSCIIIKKEEPKPKYVPFESIEEFLTAYFKSVANSECIQKTISSTGIWLKHNDAFLLVVEIWDRGVVIGDGKMETMKIGEDKYLTTNFIIEWHELYEKYTFLNGTPCGKEVTE